MLYYLNLGFLCASVVIPIGLAIHTWRRRRVPGAVPAIGMMAGVILWSSGYIFERLHPGLSTQLASNYISYLGVVSVPLMLVLFAIRYAGYGHHITTRNVMLLSIIPAISMIMVWTSNYHSLMWYDARVETAGDFSVVIKPAFPISN